MLVFLEEKLKASSTQFGLIFKFSHQIQNGPIWINKVKDWTFRFLKNMSP